MSSRTKIILKDEATASLDVENETKVQGALSRLLTGKRVLVIAHRMRLLFEVIIFCLVYALLIKVAKGNNPLNCLYFYPESVRKKAYELGLADEQSVHIIVYIPACSEFQGASYGSDPSRDTGKLFSCTFCYYLIQYRRLATTNHS